MASYVIELPFSGTVKRWRDREVSLTIPGGTKALWGKRAVTLYGEGGAAVTLRMTGPGATRPGTIGDPRQPPIGVWFLEIRGRRDGDALYIEGGTYRAAIGRAAHDLRTVEARVGVSSKTPAMAAAERRRILRALDRGAS